MKKASKVYVYVSGTEGEVRKTSPSIKKSLKESIADVESEISVAEAQGNTRKANALKIILKRLKGIKKK